MLGAVEPFAPGVVTPELAHQGGWHLVDLNGDKHDDLVISNADGYGVYLFNPVEKKNVDWKVGWTQVLREGKPGDANSLPSMLRRDGDGSEVSFREGALWIKNEQTQALPGGVKKIPYRELLRVPGPAPMSAEQSLQALQATPGWEVRLVAAEPLVQDPVFVDWDEQGRLWVVEMGDYPFAPGEKTKDGSVGQGQVSALQGGRIKILTDEDGDGVYDKATTFLEGLLHPTGLAFWKGGVFVSNIPDIFYAKDTNGDGKCDKRETWFTGFTAGNPQHLVNGFCLGLDGWLHGANGDSGGEITCVRSGQKVSLGTNDFRFHPTTGDFKLEAGRSQYGKWRDDFGNWFGNNNSTMAWHYHLPLGYLERHPERVAKSVRAVVNEDKTLHPIAPALRRYNWADATNTLTSGCSPMPWRRGQETWLMVCEPQNNLVHRELLDDTAFPLRSRRHPEDTGKEFLASRDPWFRPTMARPGPDGALYVVDMYRLVLEHPEWIPAEIARGLDLRAGETMGRIYRVSESGRRAEGPVMISRASAAQEMASPIRWRRDTAQRLLLEDGGKSGVPKLLEVAETAAEETARLQALWTAALLNGDETEKLIAALQAAHPRVRGAALLAAGSEAISKQELESWFPAESKAAAVVAAPVITQVNADRQKVVARYVKAGAELAGDAKRGQVVYQRACMACHQWADMGIELGPNLATVAMKPPEQIVEAIFDPNRAVEQRNAATQVMKKDGSIVLGLIVAETPNHLTLRAVGGLEVVVPRADIKDTKLLSISYMPEGLESVLTEQDCADLLALIRGQGR